VLRRSPKGSSQPSALVRLGFASRHALPLWFPRARCELSTRDQARHPFLSQVGRARSARSRSPHGGTGAPLRTAHVPNIHPAGMRSGSDPGRHRPMSATHDFVFREGALVSVHSASRIPYASQRLTVHAVSSPPRRSGMPCASVFFSRRIILRTGHASSPHGSPAERSLQTAKALLRDIASTGVARGPNAVALESSGYPPMAKTGFTVPHERLTGPLRSEASSSPAAYFSPSTFEGSSGARGRRSRLRPACSRFRMAAGASAVFQPTVGTFACLWSRSLNRCPHSSEEAPLAWDQCGPWVRCLQGAELRSGEPSLRSAPPSASSRYLRHRPVIIGGWVTPTSSEPVETVLARGPFQPVPSTTHVRSAGASHTPYSPEEV